EAAPPAWPRAPRRARRLRRDGETARARPPRASRRERLSERDRQRGARADDTHPLGLRRLRRPRLAARLPTGLAPRGGARASSRGVGVRVRPALRLRARARAAGTRLAEPRDGRRARAARRPCGDRRVTTYS